jgi:RNA polymerase sigma-70 factor, ECF subfamily
VTDDELLRRFELLALPHLDAAYNLAWWLTRNEHDAQDIVQEASLRALRYFRGFRGDRVRPWLLQIVRHTGYSWLEKNRPQDVVALDDSEEAWRDLAGPSALEPQTVAAHNADRARLNAAMLALPVAWREVLVLRELEELSYKDIARIADIPVGTVMSRLSRARDQLRRALSPAARPMAQTASGTGTREGAT